jgi:hypothetical protein
VVHQILVVTFEEEKVTLAVTCLPSCEAVTENVLPVAPEISAQPSGSVSEPVTAASQANHW